MGRTTIEHQLVLREGHFLILQTLTKEEIMWITEHQDTTPTEILEPPRRIPKKILKSSMKWLLQPKHHQSNVSYWMMTESSHLCKALLHQAQNLQGQEISSVPTILVTILMTKHIVWLI